MLSSLNLLATSATDEHPVDMRSSRVHVPIAPNPHPSARTSEPSSSGSPDHAQYRSRTRRARPLIQNKCEECVVARQKCTWSTSSESCDRCRRLDKKCRARESLIKEEEQLPLPLQRPPPPPRIMGHDTVMQGSDFSGVSQSTASAALALTALSAGAEDRKIIEPVVIKRSPPFIPPLAPTNVYHVQESDYKPSRQPISRPAIFFPEQSTEKMSGMKRKLPKKGNNPHGNVGTYKCARCRELKAKCLYTQEDRPCKRCSTAGKSCGPKTLARENEATSRTQAESHKPQTSRSHPWSVNKPLLPKILESVGPEMVSEVASKLYSELAILHAIVHQNPIFRSPSEGIGRDNNILPRLPEIIEVNAAVSSSYNHLSPSQEQRVSRAVSLPPNPELIHSRPDQQQQQQQQQPAEERIEKKPIIELPRMKTEIRQESFSHERRTLGDGIPQYQPYCCQCAVDQGLHIREARPASTTQFNQHPKGVCRMYHPHAVQWALGCSLHRGVLDEGGRCESCQREKKTATMHPATLLRQTGGYPGDEYL